MHDRRLAGIDMGHERGDDPLNTVDDERVDNLKFTCKQCGHCCLNLSGAIEVCATEEDIRRWQENNRTDILAWVDVIYLGEENRVYDIWINPRTGEDVSRCPWLRKLPGKDRCICRIQDMKPDHCRKYPLSREHAESTGCPGFEYE